jgi:hypothetical protein
MHAPPSLDGGSGRTARHGFRARCRPGSGHAGSERRHGGVIRRAVAPRRGAPPPRRCAGRPRPARVRPRAGAARGRRPSTRAGGSPSTGVHAGPGLARRSREGSGSSRAV